MQEPTDVEMVTLRTARMFPSWLMTAVQAVLVGMVYLVGTGHLWGVYVVQAIAMVTVYLTYSFYNAIANRFNKDQLLAILKEYEDEKNT